MSLLWEKPGARSSPCRSSAMSSSHVLARFFMILLATRSAVLLTACLMLLIVPERLKPHPAFGFSAWLGLSVATGGDSSAAS